MLQHLHHLTIIKVKITNNLSIKLKTCGKPSLMLTSIGRHIVMLTVSIKAFAVNWNRHIISQIKSGNCWKMYLLGF